MISELKQTMERWWQDLVNLFPGVPEPSIRPCPKCGESLMFHESPYKHFGCDRCGYIERI
jgi:hypothetical protein